MIAPYAGDLVDQRLQRMRILEHVGDGEIGSHVQGDEGRERKRNEQQLGKRSRARDIHQGGIAPTHAKNRQGRLDQGQAQRQHQRVMSGFRDHCDAPCFAGGAALCAARDASGFAP